MPIRTAAAYRAAQAVQRPSWVAGKPVTAVEYTFARAYAQTVGKRMLRDDEYDAASRTVGFVAAPGLWEWVDAGKDPQTTVRQPGKTATRTGTPKDVTFRFAMDL